MKALFDFDTIISKYDRSNHVYYGLFGGASSFYKVNIAFKTGDVSTRQLDFLDHTPTSWIWMPK